MFISEKYGPLLYNSETNSFATLEYKLYQQLLDFKNSKTDINTFDSDVINQLIKGKIITEQEQSVFQTKKLKYYLNIFNSSALSLAIAPTTACNFDCPYCYEKNIKAIFMTKETENNLISFIKKHDHIQAINLEWYGGEPLIGFEVIHNLLDKLSQELSDISLKSHQMITNGFLLDEDKSRFFMRYPLDSIQITIDGNKHTHDQRRILKSGKGTYDTIISNIDTFLEYNKDTLVLIRVNIDTTNAAEFHSLYKMLMERWNGKKVTIYPAFIQNYAEACSNSCNVLSSEDQMNFYIDLFEKYGTPINTYPHLLVGGCGATNINYYVVGPNGELYKCWNDIGIQEKIIGFLDKDNIPNKEVLCQYLVGPTMFDDPQCNSCSLSPICNGGCQWMRLKNINEGGKFDLCTNKKDHLNTFLELHYAIQKAKKA
jgi:uncharacterized protein